MTKKILLVEDDVDLLRIYQEILEMEGFDTHTAENGEEGIEKFKEVNPSLTIMDGEMPIMNGYEDVIIPNDFQQFD